MQNPLVSIIIPNFNKANFVKETLCSLMAQTCANFEVVIVDDASTDDSVRAIEETIKDDARFKLIKQPQGQGGSAARNLGFANSNGEFVMFFDSDDLLTPTCLERRVKTFLMAENRDIDFCVFPMGCFKKEVGDSASTWIPVKGQDDLSKFLAHQMPWTIMQPLWKRGFLEKLKIGNFVGPFDEEFPRLQDVEMHTRALLIGAKYQVCGDDEPDCYYRIDENRSTHSLEKQLENKMLGFLMYLQKISLILLNKPMSSRYKRNLLGTLFEAWHQLCQGYEMGQVSTAFFKRQKGLIQEQLVRLDAFSWKLKIWYLFYEFAFLKCKACKVKGFNWFMKRVIQL